MKPMTTVLSCSAAAMIVAGGWAQQQQEQRDRRPTDQTRQRQQAERQTDTRSLHERIAQPDTMLHHVADVHGKSVENMQGESLGSIDTLIADFDSGRVTHAVVSVGGFLGIADTLIAVPWEAFQLRPMYEGLVLDVSRSELEAAPSFERTSWPDFGDQNWRSEVDRYYGTTPGMRPGMRGMDRQQEREQWRQPSREQQQQHQTQQIEQRLSQAFTRAGMDRQEAQSQAQDLAQQIVREQPGQQELRRMIEEHLTDAGVSQQQAQQEAQRLAQTIEPMVQRRGQQRPLDGQQRGREGQQATGQSFARTTELIGTAVENHEGESLGNLDNIAMDIQSGEFEFAVVGTGGFLGMWQSHVSVPWHALEVTRQDEEEYQIVLNATREQLDRAPEYDNEKWPTPRDAEWGRDIFQGGDQRPMRDRTRDPMRHRNPQGE